MTDTHTLTRPDQKVEHFDVLIVGAGISGIGGAAHLIRERPGTRFVILDSLADFGGTWRTHIYPGVRSDSDLYTFGYEFKPWVGPPIASAEEILRYMGEVIEDYHIAPHIRYKHKILSADWSSRDNLWTVTARRADTGETAVFTTNFLWMCQGYYRHEKGYTPDWDGMEDYRGQIVHPQTWPEDLDYKGKNVLVIGSGATTATVVPAIAGDTAHVTVLQRSPTWFIPGLNVDDMADQLRLLKIDETWIHEIVRRKRLHDQQLMTKRALEEPEAVAAELLGAVRAFLGPDYDIDKHFTPRYRPWRQRIAFIPNGDLFQGIASGKASIVTDEIDRFVPEGVRTRSGEVLKADIVVTATGFNLNVLGDIAFSRDGEPLDLADTVTYRGMMFTGVPNLVWVFGYFRASWTLRADLIGHFVCRLLAHMEEKGVKRVEPVLRPEDHNMPLSSWIDPENFNPGYLMRGMHLLPKSGDKAEWRHTQDYWVEKDVIPAIDLDGAEFAYS